MKWHFKICLLLFVFSESLISNEKREDIPVDIISGLDKLEEIQNIWEKVYIHVIFTKKKYENRDVQLKYFSKIPNYSLEDISKRPSGIEEGNIYIDLKKFGNRIRIRHISDRNAKNGSKTERNTLVVFDGDMTRILEYPEEESIDTALISKKTPSVDIQLKDHKELLSDEDPLAFLREILGLGFREPPIKFSELLSILIDTNYVLDFQKIHSDYVVSFKERNTTDEIHFHSSVDFLPTARINGMNERGIEGEQWVEYQHVSNNSIETWFPKEMGMKTYHTNNFEKELMLEHSIKIEHIEIAEKPPADIFNLKSLPGLK